LRLETRPSEIRDVSHDAELQLIVSDNTREPSLRVGPNSTTISNDNGRPKLRFHANGGDHKTGSITYETNSASLVDASNTGGEMQIHTNTGERIASFGSKSSSVNQYITIKDITGLNNTTYAIGGITSNIAQYLIESRPPSDGGAETAISVSDIYKGLQIRNRRGYCNLDFSSTNPDTNINISKGGRIRLETRPAFKYNINNTTEIHFLDNDDSNMCIMGNLSSKMNTLDTYQLNTASLSAAGIDMTPQDYNVNGTWSGPRTSVFTTLHFRRMGDTVFYAFPPIGSDYANNTQDFFVFSALASPAITPSATASRCLNMCSVWNANQPWAIGFVAMLSSREITVQMANGGIWYSGQSSGWSTTLTGCFRLAV